ncbi:hypothetical protein DIPPA_03250 [Diplonema papillatum]|nr:hypothetical protein DIPPA_03250 [Diplonema papillatum]
MLRLSSRLGAQAGLVRGGRRCKSDVPPQDAAVEVSITSGVKVQVGKDAAARVTEEREKMKFLRKVQREARRINRASVHNASEVFDATPPEELKEKLKVARIKYEADKSIVGAARGLFQMYISGWMPYIGGLFLLYMLYYAEFVVGRRGEELSTAPMLFKIIIWDTLWLGTVDGLHGFWQGVGYYGRKYIFTSLYNY